VNYMYPINNPNFKTFKRKMNNRLVSSVTDWILMNKNYKSNI